MIARSPQPYELRWGVLTSDGVGAAFARDVLISPITRGVVDVSHRLVAVGTGSKWETEAFFKKYLSDLKLEPPQVKPRAYWSFRELIDDPEVDVVYISTLYLDHFRNAMECLHAGKHVLMDKPSTINASQQRELMRVAAEKELFLMEGVWTQLLPIAVEVRKLIDAKAIGQIKHVSASFMLNVGGDDDAATNRFHNSKVGGGCLLDLGPYPWAWILNTVHRSLYGPPCHSTPPFTLPVITSQAVLNCHKVDESVTALFTFSPQLCQSGAGTSVTASFHTSIASLPPAEGHSCIIYGTNGTISLDFPTSRPTRLTLEKFDLQRTLGTAPLAKSGVEKSVLKFDIPGDARGYCYEMDEVARCVRDGLNESEVVPWNTTLLSMEVFDEIRRQNGCIYTESLESAVYPVDF